MTLNNKTKDNIIKSAVQLVQKKGYSETSIQEIVKQSKAPQGSIYYYFPKGKDEIICAALDKISDEFSKTFAKKSKKCKDPEAVLRLLVDLFVNKEEKYGTPSFRITLLALETVGQAKTVADKASEMLRNWKSSLAEELEKVGVHPAYSLNIARWFCITLQGAICSAAIKDNTTFKGTMEHSIQLLSLSNDEQLEKIFKKSDLEN
ncbi:TetR/AcrR family transcriptional regulator [Gemella sp. 19428wG2_WT2a]|nr:TetR/AcrR family transcriptional regulator [Gemella sp. 19428wG2_WT2a]TFU58808.1 TetR/AcrR family transcriptional regulator [Gemella sp. WT2a]